MTYNWQDDSHKCWLENLHWQRVLCGLATFKSPLEMYIIESWGLVP
jgi:hypothetical protein